MLDSVVIEDLDAWISEEDVFKRPPELTIPRRENALRSTVAQLREEIPAFDRYCTRVGFADTLERLPYVPSALFKTKPELVRAAGVQGIETTSSGTQGSVSRVYRDDLTLMRFFGTITASVRGLLGVEGADTAAYNLGPRIEEVKDLWISYVMSGVSLVHDSDFYVRGGNLVLDQLLRDLETQGPGQAIIVGPPALVREAAVFAKARGGLHFGHRMKVVTIGGWKRRDHERISREELNDLVCGAFGLDDDSEVRDAFNMVELNTVVMECARHALHVPPWLYVEALDPRSLDPLPSGQPGVLAYADPTARSFPCFVASDDFGVVDRGVPCQCGVTGDVIRVERRINTMETRGCALKM